MLLVAHANQAWKGAYNKNVSPNFCVSLTPPSSSLIADMRISHTLVRQRRSPCFPQIDLTFRAVLYEKKPRFIVLFSHQTTSYSQILFTHASYVPDEDIFYDYPTGCPNPCCTDDCEMIRFPRRGLETASVLEIKRGGKFGKKVRVREMCNWIECSVCFSDEPAPSSYPSDVSEGSVDTASSAESNSRATGPLAALPAGQLCSKCRLVKYCSLEHQRKYVETFPILFLALIGLHRDWEEHRRVCMKMT